MRAASYSAFGGEIGVGSLPDPVAGPLDVVVEVRATGICRSDWHGWQGHDPDITVFPHVPGHEFAGVIADVGSEVDRWSVGDRVAVPFISGCGHCDFCAAGDPQICPDQTQAGFTHWGSFAERVLVRNADHSVVPLPGGVDFAGGAVLGCRFSTADRAVVDQGSLVAGQTVAVYGCGGVGLSAIMIAAALGATPIGVDPRPEARALAIDAGATVVLDPESARSQLLELDGGGPHVTMDAVGAPNVVADAVAAVRRGGRHVQVGLLPDAGSFAEIVASRVVAHEITIVGSHGISPAGLGKILRLVSAGDLRPERLIGRCVDLAGGVEALMQLDSGVETGITVITDL